MLLTASYFLTPGFSGMAMLLGYDVGVIIQFLRVILVCVCVFFSFFFLVKIY